MSEPERSSMDVEKRMLLAIALSMAILMLAPYIYQRLFPPPPQPVKPAPVQRVQQPEAPAEAPVPPPPIPTAPAAGYTKAKARSISIENENFILRWNTAGGILESALLKNMAKGQKALETIPKDLPETLPRPFQLRLEDEDLDKTVTRAVYEVVGTDSDTIKAPADLTLRLRTPDVEVYRRIRVPATGFAIDIETYVRQGNRSLPYYLFLGPGIGPEGHSTLGDFANPAVAYWQDGSVTRYTAGDVDEAPANLQVPARWVAMDGQYFAYGILDDKDIRSFLIKKSDIKRTDPKNKKEFLVPLLTAQVGMARDSRFRVFVAPKDNEVLQRVDPQLASLVDYGWFSIIVKPLLVSLKLVYQYVGNYGWAIIILTFIINLALFPVRWKQMVSMKKMSDLQPKMRSIQDRYKRMKRDDPRKQEMNVEIMKLYKEHGVNPLGGCLPLVIQMPFLFAFYRMLASSFELRGAPFMLWIQDLSQHDPYYITPIIMGVTMVIQQKMTPATGDPAQRRMMMMLPLVMTFFFLNVSSGLAVYFLFSNVFGMMFQFLLQRWTPDLKPKTASAK